MILVAASGTWSTGNLSLVADIVSIAGFVLTIFILRSLRRIRNEFLFNARLPRIRKDIVTDRRNLESAMRNSSRSQIERCLGELRASIESLIRKVPKAERQFLVDFVREMPQKEDDFERGAQRVLNRLDGVLRRMENMEEDSKWSLRDGS